MGKMGKFITFLCQVSSGCCIPKIIKIARFIRAVQKINEVWDDVF